MKLVHPLKSALRARLEPYVLKWSSDYLFSQENACRLSALVDSAGYVRGHMKEAEEFPDKQGVFRKALESAPKTGIFAEFGVWRGTTINAIADFVGAGTTVHGFDSFEGLPEDWFGKYTKGTFHMDQLPPVRANVKLHKGWFDATVPQFALESGDQPIAMIHVDCDLYSSTKTIFDHLGDRLVPGSVILFDEYFNYPGWRDHEYKAFQELVARLNLRYRYLAYNSREFNVAVQIV
ncbi:MAG: hypothetical protein JWQ33_308 [Ramlibacter sp.]|nr:hypothetical protein [Ramlibacter sp.]